MRLQKTILTIATLALLGTGMTSCQSRNNETQASEDTVVQAETPMTYLDAIEDYLVDSIGAYYAPGEVCIPAYSIIATTECDNGETLVWGDWWVFNYNIVDDTLKCVSGGSHPGLMIVQQSREGFRVLDFDRVEDGSRWTTSAKRIFGKHFEAFLAVNSNQELRDSVRLEMVSGYVRDHNVQVSCLQDFGYPAIQLVLQ